MATKIQRVGYYSTAVKDEPGEAYALLSRLAETGVNLLAFTGVPVGPTRTQLSIFPEDAHVLEEAARKVGFELDGPHPALLVQGDDELGALAGIHARLSDAGVNVFASMGVADGRGSYGYLLYVRPEAIDAAMSALGLTV